MTPFLRPAALLALLACTACGSVPSRDFEFDAIDVGENPLRCLVVVNDDWVGAEQKNQFVNVAGDDVLTLKIEFRTSEVEVIMAPVQVNNGKVTKVPRSRKEAREFSGFMDDSRKLLFTDPKRVLFILPRKPANS